MKISTIGIISILIGLINISSSQNLYFNSYTFKEGLSQNSVYSIAQTKEGFVWVGTQDGLNRFDGNKFLHINPTGNKNGVAYSKMITCLFADEQDWLWVGTTAELLLYDRYHNKWYNAEAIYKGFEIANSSWIKCIKEEGNFIWVGTQDNGLFCYNKQDQKMLKVSVEDNMPSDIISFCIYGSKKFLASKNAVYVLKNGVFMLSDFKPKSEILHLNIINDQFWILLSNGNILITDETFNKTVDFKNTYYGNKFLSDPKLTHQVNDTTLWIGSRSDGLIKVNLKRKTFINSSDAAPGKNTLKTQFILSLFSDHQSNTFIGLSGGGLSIYHLKSDIISTWKNTAIKSISSPDNMILSMLKISDHEMLCGTLYGGLMYKNLKNGSYKYYNNIVNSKNPSDLNNIYSIVKDKNHYWLAARAGIFKFQLSDGKLTLFNNETDVQSEELCSMIKLKGRDSLLIASYNGNIRMFNTKTYQFEKCQFKSPENDKLKLRARYMLEKEDGNVFFSTEVRSLCHYNYRTRDYTEYPQFINVSGISRHFDDSGKFLWIASDDGLIQVEKNSKKILKTWTVADGLPNNYIYAVLVDNEHKVWIATNAGIAAINYETKNCIVYTDDEGLQSMEFNTAVCFKDTDGSLWFGGIDGFNRINPKINHYSDYIPKPIITEIEVMNSPFQSNLAIPYIHDITLPYNKNFIQFEFQALNFAEKENTKFRYKLSSVDTNWVYSGNRNFANYTQLKPGSYTFYLQAAIKNKEWNDQYTVLNIYLSPPWYKTWWSYVVFLSLLIFLIQYWYFQRVKAIKAKSDIKHKMAETEMAALKAQMNPHFIFNCINGIDAFIQTNDKYNASFYLNKFAKLIRNILDSSKHNLVSLERDIETIKLYVELEEMRTDNKFKSQFIIENDLFNYDINIPPLIVQPYVENAIIHGLRNKDCHDGLLTISIKKDGDMLTFEIKDNGIGRSAAALISKKKEHSYGMQLSRDRVLLHNEEEANPIEIIDLYNGEVASGTMIVVKLKIK